MKLIYLLLVTLFFTVNSCSNDSHTYGIAYITDKTGNFDIFVSDKLGDNHTQLTNNPGFDWSPKWNEASQQIIYYSMDTSKQFHINAMNTKGQQYAMEDFDLEEFILSPDGNKILYTKEDSNLQKNQSIKLTNTPTREKYMSWSNNPSELLFTSHYRENEYNDIFKINTTTKEIIQITSDTLLYEEISWSPDGSLIAFHAKQNNQHHIYTMDINGKNEQKLTKARAFMP